MEMEKFALTCHEFAIPTKIVSSTRLWTRKPHVAIKGTTVVSAPTLASFFRPVGRHLVWQHKTVVALLTSWTGRCILISSHSSETTPDLSFGWGSLETWYNRLACKWLAIPAITTVRCACWWGQRQWSRGMWPVSLIQMLDPSHWYCDASGLHGVFLLCGVYSAEN